MTRTGLVLILLALATPVLADTMAWYDTPGRWFKSLGTAGKGDTAPDALGVNPAGEPQHLSGTDSPYTLLVFWASWCPNCKVELPQIEDLAARYRDQGLTVLLINVMDEEAAARKYIERSQSDLQFILDREGLTEKRYAIISLPTTVLVRTADAEIIKRWAGRKDVPKIERLVAELTAMDTSEATR